MIKINTGDHSGSIHGTAFLAIPGRHRHRVEWALRELVKIPKSHPRADTYFTSLPGGRSLTQLLDDTSNDIWINYSADTSAMGFALTTHATDIWLGRGSLRYGKRAVLATIIHELAHINGASGRDHAAERAVYECGLGGDWEFRTGIDNPFTPYHPGTSG